MKKLYTALILAGAALTASPQLTAQTTDMPYEISFTSSNYNTWTAVDDNKYPSEANWKNLAWMWNNNSWWYSLTSAGKEASDDWVISPAFAISEGTQYEITYRIDRYTGDKIEATLELVDGLESPKGLQTIDTWEINADKGKDKTVTFTASTSGNLRFGIHMTMIYPGSVSKIQFKSFAIKALSKATAPAGVAALEVVPGANGAATATINFRTPVKDAEGNDLTGNVTVSLYREDEATPFFTSAALAPDTESSAVDSEALTGETWYIAKASNDGG